MRHNFTQPTIKMLALRVAYTCSNPECGKTTVGPHTDSGKAAIIGIAAHITAAAPGGPRYDALLSESERCHLKNGIWLCSNCSTIIDKDSALYPKEIVVEWKETTEAKFRNLLAGNSNHAKPPFIEADLIWAGGSREFLHYSEENFKPGQPRILRAEDDHIAHYRLDFRFNLILHNHSSVPAFNVKAVQTKGHRLDIITKLNRKNNVASLANIDLRVTSIKFFKGYHFNADELIGADIPDILLDCELEISYLDEHRKEYKTIVTFTKDGIHSVRATASNN